MAINISLPLSNKGNLEDLIFSILTKEYPLRIIDLMNFVRKRYGRGVTFQAVRKAILQLIEKEIVIEEERKYSINKKWIIESKKKIDSLYDEIYLKKEKPSRVDSIKGEINVFSFNSLNELMKFWQNLIDDWFKKFKKGDYPVNCYQSAHVWEGLLHPDIEKNIMHQLKKKKIRSYTITPGNTTLDKQIIKFYTKIGINAHLISTNSSFDKSYYVATYGDLIVQTQYPKEIVKLLEDFFKKSKSLKDLDLVELSNIVNKKIEIKLTVIKNLAMAKQINKSIISQID